MKPCIPGMQGFLAG